MRVCTGTFESRSSIQKPRFGYNAFASSFGTLLSSPSTYSYSHYKGRLVFSLAIRSATHPSPTCICSFFHRLSFWLALVLRLPHLEQHSPVSAHFLAVFGGKSYDSGTGESPRLSLHHKRAANAVVRCGDQQQLAFITAASVSLASRV
jgi:hypothetical protein